jgi:hypothetical protein
MKMNLKKCLSVILLILKKPLTIPYYNLFQIKLEHQNNLYQIKMSQIVILVLEKSQAKETLKFYQKKFKNKIQSFTLNLTAKKKEWLKK